MLCRDHGSYNDVLLVCPLCQPQARTVSGIGGTVGLDTMREISGPRLAELEAIERAVGWVQKNSVCVGPLLTGAWGMIIYGADRTEQSYVGETWLQAVQKAMAAGEGKDEC